MNDKELGDVWGLNLKGLRSRFHISIPTGLKPDRWERISADPLDIYGPVGTGMGGEIFHKI